MKKIVMTTAALSAMLLNQSVFADYGTKITPYGSVRVGLESNDIDGADEDIEGRDFLSRFGLAGSQKITQGLTVVGKIEYGLDATETASDSKLRLGYVGLKGDLGQLTFGSQTLVWHKFVRGSFFSDGTDTLRLGAIRDSDLLNYYNSVGGLKFGLAAQFEGSEDGDDLNTFQAGGEFKIGAVKLQAAILKDGSGENTGTLIGLRPRVSFGNTHLALVYHNASDDFDFYGANLCGDGGDTTMTGLYAKQKIGKGFIHSRYMTKSCDDAANEASSIKLEYVHTISKKARFWVSGESLDNETKPDDTELQIGFRFDF